MTNREKEFYDSYVYELECCIYEDETSENYEDNIYNCLREATAVLGKTIPDIKDGLCWKTGCAQLDGKIVLQKLNLYLIENGFYDNENKESRPNPKAYLPAIFISHRSADKKYGDALRKFIIGLGVKNDQLIYTSHPLNKIPLDRNIYEYLRDCFSSDLFVIILWSNEYLNSPACLNEMGALWVAQKDYTNIYTPSFNFGNPKYHECAVDTRKMGAVLNGNDNCKTSMIELKNKIQSMFSLKDNEKESTLLLDEFIRDISEEA